MNLFASEWIKARSVHSTWILAASAVVVTVMVSLLGVSGLVADGQTALPTDFDPTGISFKGILVGQILLATIGAQAITSEYGSGQIITSLAIVPRRGALLASKLAVSALIGMVVAVAAVAGSFGATQAALATAGLPLSALDDPDTARAIACAIVYLVLTAVLGLGFGIITRSSSGALAIIVTVALLVPALAPGMPGALGEFAGTYWPTTAGQASYAVATTSGMPPLVGLGIMAIFSLGTTLGALVVLRARDV
ncbi:ABC transporter permease [Microbacterium sp. cf332]|uniref:ABC transporter permease n=1 Tax=Microbacterium sp. cf332 TaxID=1761804 RepID=UPI00088C8714|nr:ABC transporter permease [Microbacterium sp. cf332]SDQ88379.1 ABC-2 family transporter protein [Microbacterium sp. cf332]